MGLLSRGTPLSWPDSEKFREFVSEHGIIQLLHIYERYKNRKCDDFKWGDEIEYFILHVPPNERLARLKLRSAGVLTTGMALIEENAKKSGQPQEVRLLPEYGSYHIEATPGQPFGDTASELRRVEENMRLRRMILEHSLQKDEILLTMGNFPRLGAGQCTEPPTEPKGPNAMSDYISDALTNPHPRFGCLTRNIRLRRGRNVDIHVPLFRDEKTDPDQQTIHMDAMVFGMGMSCLQVTFQAQTLCQARHLYDQNAVLAPIMLALTAATPFYRGQVSDIDVRWTVIAQSVDDRTAEELDKDSPQYRRKSRYDTIDLFISGCPSLKPSYNDVPIKINDSVFKTLMEAGMGERLARHFAHLWIRDPLVIYKEIIQLDDSASTNHFENIQSTNWNTVRFKPPPPNSDIGWRVEFRSMEVQLTDFENAAFATFIALCSRAFLYFKMMLYMPISRIDENMSRAHVRDAVNTQRFFWRDVLRPTASGTGPCGDFATVSPDAQDGISERSLDEIFNGENGLVGIVRDYLTAIKCDEKTMECMDRYLQLISLRAAGKLWTTSKWLRSLVAKSPLYKQDSNISDELNRDIVDACHRLTHGTLKVPEMFGDVEPHKPVNYTQPSPLVASALVHRRVTPLASPQLPPAALSLPGHHSPRSSRDVAIQRERRDDEKEPSLALNLDAPAPLASPVTLLSMLTAENTPPPSTSTTTTTSTTTHGKKAPPPGPIPPSDEAKETL